MNQEPNDSKSTKGKPDKWFVPTSRVKESTADFDNPLDLNTILELSAKGDIKRERGKT